ncbi:MAG: type II secretion system F family protein [Alkalimonas sp.]|nr:type II secretion system F family protein [Alkalimonas sp.]
MANYLAIYLVVFVSIAVLTVATKRIGTKLALNYERNFTTAARTNLSDMFLFIEPKQLFLINTLTLIFVPVIFRLLIGTWLIGILISIILAILPRFAYSYMHKRRRKLFIKQLPDALNMVSMSVRAGVSLNAAIEFMTEQSAPPISQEFSLFLREQRLGVDFNTSLQHVLKRVPAQEFQLVVSAMKISREVGGNIADVLMKQSETLRKKIEMDGKINALTAQGKLQGIVMTLLPFFIFIALFHIEPSAMRRIFTDPIGWGLMAVTAIMLTFGYAIIQKIVRIDV